MGCGDWIMATGHVRELFERHRVPVLVVGAHGKPMWHEVFDNNPKIIRKPHIRQQYVRLVSGGGYRPYIERKEPQKWTWKPYTPPVGELFFTAAELAFAEPYRGMVMVEPSVKAATGHHNKAWLPERWRQLTDALMLPWVQCGPPETNWLPGVSARVVTPTFRHAAAVLSVCNAFVSTEGGLHHAAAAVGTPSVILWSEFIDTSVTGYATMRNLRHAGPACGMRVDCPGCRASMARITVDEVARNLWEILDEGRPGVALAGS